MQALEQWIYARKINCSSLALELMGRHARELQLWNHKRKLTSIKPGKDTEIKHYVDSLLGLQVIDIAQDDRVLDLGSGPGFPGLPVSLCTGCHLTLVDANQHRVNFLQHVIEKLQLEQVAVVKARAEELGRDPRYRGHYTRVLCRAVAPLPVLMELGMPLLERYGFLVAWKGPGVETELEAGQRAALQLGGGKVAVDQLALPEAYGQRSLVQVRKDGETPKRFPRRPGIPGKRPLGV